ncbi:hypothetical protein LBMAG53_13180 [Planctomycetota bacterium]|nr:hypothetical protein LBMAG53_13180 [Planctomycetota bacterium]
MGRLRPATGCRAGGAVILAPMPGTLAAVISLVMPAGPHTTTFSEGIMAYARRHELPWRIGQVLNKQSVAATLVPTPGVRQVLAGWVDEPLPRNLHAVVVSLRNSVNRAVVSMHDGAVGVLAAEHLYACGYRHLAIAKDGRNPVESARNAGFVAWIERQGGKVARLPPLPPTRDVDRSEWQRRFASWVAAAPGPIGLFSYQDRPALWLLEDALAAGIRVPEQLGIVGVDDCDAASEAEPGLSSVIPPWQVLGHEVAIQVHRRLCGAPPVDPVTVAPVRVAARGSTALAQDGGLVADLRRRLEQQPGMSAADWAVMLGCTVRHLHRRCRRETGCSAKDILQNARLERARELLLKDDRPLGEIAVACGWAYDTGFIKAFTHAHGIPPGRWRQAHQTAVVA